MTMGVVTGRELTDAVAMLADTPPSEPVRLTQFYRQNVFGAGDWIGSVSWKRR
jgi:hypothetical protein